MPAALARPAHHEQVTRSGPVQKGWATTRRPQPERTGRAEGDERDDCLAQLLGHPVTMPRDAVSLVTVEVHPDLGDRIRYRSDSAPAACDHYLTLALSLFPEDVYEEVATRVTGSLDRWGCWNAA